jgi:hypothetical protein
MIQRKDLLAFAYYDYKNSKFTGSLQGMRYQIRRYPDKAEDKDNANAVFQVSIWPGPYNFASTADEKKTITTFPFTEESLDAITDYLNDAYEAGKETYRDCLL